MMDDDLDFELTFEHNARGTPPPLSSSPTKHDNDTVSTRRRGSGVSENSVVSANNEAGVGGAKKPTVNRVAELQSAAGVAGASGNGAAAAASTTTTATTTTTTTTTTMSSSGTNTFNVAGARLSPIVSADTEALMRRLVAGAAAGGGLGHHAGGGVVGGAAGGGSVGSIGSAGGYFLNANSTPFSSSYNPSAYGSSPSFADLALTKTAESLAASNGVAVENCNGVIVYGEAGTALRGAALLELVASLRLPGEVQRHWVREGQHFAFLEFAADVDIDVVARRIASLELDSVRLTCEPCSRITPGRDPRTHISSSDFKNSTLVLKNVPFQLRQEMLAEVLAQLPVQPVSLNYHYDATGAFRGMAFVKYATIDDAYRVFDELNGLDIMGRALRVEYKRRTGENEGVGSTASTSTTSSTTTSAQQQQHHASAASRPLDPQELAADARAFYDQLMAFKANSRLQELAFPPSLTVHQRKQLHYLADHIGGLAHSATGDGATRFLVVSKVPAQVAPHRENGGASPAIAVSSHAAGGRSWTSNERGARKPTGSGSQHNSFTGGSSWGSRGRKGDAALSSSPKSFASMLERDSNEGGSGAVQVGSLGATSSGEGGGDAERITRRPRGGTGNATDAVNQPVRQPRGPDGSSGFAPRSTFI